MIDLRLGNCYDILPTINFKLISAIIVDPPYGINLDTKYSRYPGGRNYKKIEGDDRPFDFTPFSKITVKEQFWFGAENYLPPQLQPTGNWLCWDKYPTDKSDGRLSGQFELIWSKKKHKRIIIRVKAINTSWITVKENLGHPTQKPVELMEVLIKKFTKEGDTVFDPFMGVGTVAVACKNLNRNFIGIEIDEQYFNIAKSRI